MGISMHWSLMGLVILWESHPYKTSIGFSQSMTLVSNWHHITSGQHTWCMMLDCFMLKPALVSSLLSLSSVVNTAPYLIPSKFIH